MQETLKLLAVAVAGGVVAVTLTFTLSAIAGDGDRRTDNVPRTMVYQGYLEYDGRAVNEAQKLQFDIYTSDGAGGEQLVYSETEDNVRVYSGRFAVTLGDNPDAHTPPWSFEPVIAAADDLALGIVVLTTGVPGVPIALEGRQPLVPTPFAVWSARSTNFIVENQLDVMGAANVTGMMSVDGTATVDGALNVIGTAEAETVIAGSITATTADVTDTLSTTNLVVDGPHKFKGIEVSGEVSVQTNWDTNVYGEPVAEAPAGFNSATDALCFLVRSGFYQYSSGGGHRSLRACRVEIESTTQRWRLAATLTGYPLSEDAAELSCSMRCLRWNW